MALADNGRVEATLWHERTDQLLPSLLGVFAGLSKGLVAVAAVSLVLLILCAGFELSWLFWTVPLALLYLALECLTRYLRFWLPGGFASTPSAIICLCGVILVGAQRVPVMIPWSSVTEVGLFTIGPALVHVSVEYRTAAGGLSTIILQDRCERGLLHLYEIIGAHTSAVG